MGEDYDSIPLPDGVSTIPELFRQSGYYTFIEGKTDYNFAYQLQTFTTLTTARWGSRGPERAEIGLGVLKGNPSSAKSN